MAENSKTGCTGSNEGWTFKFVEDYGIKSSVVPASTAPVGQQSTAETGGRRGSPRARINPFLARQYSDDVPQGAAAAAAEAPTTHSGTASGQQRTSAGQQGMLSADTSPVPPGSPPSVPLTGSDLMPSRRVPAAPASTEPSVMSMTSVTSARPTDSHSSPSSAVAGDDPANLTSDPGPPSSSTAASTTDAATTSFATSAAAATLSTFKGTSPPLDPYNPRSAASSGPQPDNPTSPAAAAAAANNTFSLFSPSSSPSSPPHDPPASSPSSPPHHPAASSPSSPPHHRAASSPSSPDHPAASSPSSPPHHPAASSPSSPPHHPAASSPSGSPHRLSSLQPDPSGADWPSGAASSGDEDWERRPPAERWAPLGANDADDERDDDELCLADSRRTSLGSADLSRLRKLEEEQEHLNNSLMALTTHFAQVQFRLHQIVEAPAEEKEQLLQELETFAFRGIPDVRQCKLTEDTEEELTNEWKHQELVETQRLKQRDLMQQLKTQLEDLEHYAYETGEAGLPSSVVLEKQRVIIDELKGKLNIDLNNLDRMTSEDLKSLVDCAVGQLINPLKMKEQLVNQLKTQVQDLERFISFLQGETEDGGCDGSCRRGGGGGPGAASTSGDDSGAAGDAAGHRPRLRRRSTRHRPGKHQDVHEETSSMMKRALTLLHLVTLTQFGCGAQPHRFSSNELKKTPRGNHWGDLRARLELAVSAVSELARESLRDQQEISDRGTDDSDACHGPPAAAGERLTMAVRRELAVALRDLIQHGLLQLSKSRSVVPFAGCLASRQSAPRLLHAWDLVLVYYRLKRGAQYNATPQRRLSQSFGLAVVGGTAITSKHTLLSAIGNIISSHTPLKRSADAHFKAFVCAGLNARKLSSWLRLILTTQAITEEYYQPWSYVVSTGFDDALQCVSRLEKMRFALPEDLAVRQLRNIRDAF